MKEANQIREYAFITREPTGVLIRLKRAQKLQGDYRWESTITTPCEVLIH